MASRRDDLTQPSGPWISRCQRIVAWVARRRFLEYSFPSRSPSAKPGREPLPRNRQGTVKSCRADLMSATGQI